MATAIATRAAALAAADRAALDRLAGDLDRADAPYQAGRTRQLAGRLPV